MPNSACGSYKVQCLFSCLSSLQLLLRNSSSSQLLPARVSVDPPREYLSPVHHTREFYFIADVRVGHCSGQAVQAKTPGKNKQESKDLNPPALISQICSVQSLIGSKYFRNNDRSITSLVLPCSTTNPVPRTHLKPPFQSRASSQSKQCPFKRHRG